MIILQEFLPTCLEHSINFVDLIYMNKSWMFSKEKIKSK